MTKRWIFLCQELVCPGVYTTSRQEYRKAIVLVLYSSAFTRPRRLILCLMALRFISTQMTPSCTAEFHSTANFNNDVKILEECSATMEEWYLRNGMLLNANKSDVVILSTGQQARKLPDSPVINVAGFAIKPWDSTRSLGVVTDDWLTFNKHVTAMCQSCCYHIRAFRHIHSCLTHDMALFVARWSCCQDLTIVIRSF